MIKWYFMKLLPVLLWILSGHLCIANNSSVDAARAEDVQTPWRPTVITAQDEQPTDATNDDRAQRRMDEDAWQPAIITADETAGFVVTATQRFGNEDVAGINRRNDWHQIDDGVVQSPVLRVQSQFVVDQVTGSESDRPHFEPWVQRERHVSSTRPTLTTTLKNNKAYRRPYSVARRTEELKASQVQMQDAGKSANLRNILKQTGGMSLSEILQQQNLSLDDLLKGKQNAIRALQNTATPPVESKETAKRRLPAMSQLNVNKPRRTFYNGTTRTPHLEPTARTPDDSSNEQVSTERKVVSTIPTFFADTSSTNDDRRVPPGRVKPIKEVVSAIRPDLNNSNLRKRLPNLKSFQSKVGPQISSTVEAAAEPIENQTLNDTNTQLNIENSVISSTETVLSSTPEPWRPRDSRERLSRLRNQVPTNNLTEATSVPTPTEVTSAKAASEEPIPYTIITFTTPNNEQYENDNRPLDDLTKKLNESEPEFNLVDLEDETKSKEVSSLEDLFMGDGMEEENNRNSGESESEFVLASSTSRSDSIFNADKPNSLKIFGGNLVTVIRKTLEKLDVTERNPALFTDVTSKIVDDKTELMDLLNDRRSGARLAKVLKQRNMTVDELIDHRRRGSSQLHLAEIFYNRTKARLEASTRPSPPPESGKMDVVTAFKNFPDFELESVKSVNPDEIKTDSQGSSYFTSIVNVQPTAEVMKEGRAIRKPFIIKLAENALKQNMTTQQWNENSSEKGSDENFLENSSQGIFASRHMRPSTGDESHAFQDVVDQNRNDARSHDPLDLELSGHGYKRNSVLIENAQMPIGVRSAIVASASIVLISLTIFLIIFLVCRWRQKRKRKICYSDRFQALRERIPVISSNSTSKRSTSPVIANFCVAPHSSRRSSKLNTMDPNSPEVQEYLYDAMRKPFQ